MKMIVMLLQLEAKILVILLKMVVNFIMEHVLLSPINLIVPVMMVSLRNVLLMLLVPPVMMEVLVKLPLTSIGELQ